ncbi:MAG: hypothetical protein ABI200_01890 [Gaiellales bacterium]
MHKTCFTLLLMALAALLVAGCGGSDRADYEQDLAEVGAVIERSLKSLDRSASETVGPKEIDTLAVDVMEAADQLDKIDPPDEVKLAHEQLERGLREVSAAFEQLADDLRGASTSEQQSEVFVAFATNEKIDAAFDDVIAAQTIFKDAGYRVFTAPQ